MPVQRIEESGHFDLVFLRTEGMQPGVLMEGKTRRTLCPSTCLVLEVPGDPEEEAALQAQMRRLMEVCSKTYGMAQVRTSAASCLTASRLAASRGSRALLLRPPSPDRLPPAVAGAADPRGSRARTHVMVTAVGVLLRRWRAGWLRVDESTLCTMAAAGAACCVL